MLVDDKLVSIFSQINLFELHLCPQDLIFEEGRQTVRDYYGRLVGKGNFEYLLSRFSLPSQSRRVSADIYLRSGRAIRPLPRAFPQDGLHGRPRHCSQSSHPLRRWPTHLDLRREGDTWIVETADGTTYVSRKLALATPSVAAAPAADLRPIWHGIWKPYPLQQSIQSV